jgi:peroxiredoxin
MAMTTTPATPTKLLAVLLFGAALAGGAFAADKSAGSPAPDCTLTSVGEGPNYDLKQFRGKVLYLDFWASWCTTCVKSFPFMNDLVHEFGDKGLQILGINLDEKPESAKAFLVKHPAHFTIAADRTGTCPRSFEVKAMPATYLIDRNGVVRYRHLGFRAEQTAEIRTQVASLLAEPAPAQ